MKDASSEMKEIHARVIVGLIQNIPLVVSEGHLWDEASGLSEISTPTIKVKELVIFQ
jgi:hypothetical protein